MRKHKQLLYNCIVKIVVIIFVFVGTYILCGYIEFYKFLVPQCREYIIMFIEISIGIYTTVVTLLASQKTKFTVLLSHKGYGHKFIVAISSGLITNIIACLVLSIIKAYNRLLLAFEITICIFSLLYFSMFLFILINMFRYNMSEAVKETNKENNTIDKIVTEIEEIRRRMQ